MDTDDRSRMLNSLLGRLDNIGSRITRLEADANDVRHLELLPAPEATLAVVVRSRHYVAQLLTFSVDGTLFRIPIDLLREGQYFADLLAKGPIGDQGQGSSDDDPIVLQPQLGISVADMESFLDVLMPRAFKGPIALPYSQWAAALKLATKWSFDSLSAFIVDNMDRMTPPSPFDQIRAADQCDVQRWLKPAFVALCKRFDQLTAEEGELLGYRRFAAICRVRELMRSSFTKCGNCVACKAAFKPAAQDPHAAHLPKTFSLFACLKDPADFISKEADLLELQRT